MARSRRSISMGTQSAPPAQLLAAMALLLTGFVMAPTLTEVNRTAITPWLDGKITQVDIDGHAERATGAVAGGHGAVADRLRDGADAHRGESHRDHSVARWQDHAGRYRWARRARHRRSCWRPWRCC